MFQGFRRDYLIRLPLPLAQLYSRAYNAKDARGRHDNTFYLFEAAVKLAVAPAAAAYRHEIQHGAARDEAVERELVKLALPSLGQWVGMLRALARHFDGDGTHPLGSCWEQLNRPRRDRDLPATVALFRRIKNGADGQPANDHGCSLLQLLDALVQYRNGVFGHGGPRFESFYDREMGPLLFPAVNEVLAEGVFDLLGPPGSRLVYLTEVRITDAGRAEVSLRELIGLEGERTAPLVMDLAGATGLVPHRVALLWPGRTLPLSLEPLLLYRESEVAPELLFLNRDRDGAQAEYVNYRSGRTERDSSGVRALAEFLALITGREVGESQLQALAEETRAQTPSEEVIPQAEPPGEARGDYELLAEVGRGSMGVVYLARQRSLGRVVALKVLPDELAGDDVALARFSREVRALARCEHPNIVKVLDKGQLPDGRLYYTMEYVPGCNLEQVWQELSGSHRQGDASHLGTSTWAQAVLSASRKQRDRTAARPPGAATGRPAGEGAAPAPLPPLPQLPPDLPAVPDDPGGYARRVAALVRDAALALQTVHDQNIIHRDVKPSNLVLTPDGARVVLMDFGLAKGQSVSLTVGGAGGLLGTLRYAAPEQLAAATRTVGPPADVRGLGVTLWELLTRRRLFDDAADEAQLADRIADHDVPLLGTIDPTLGPDLEAIVARATERRVADRIQSAKELADYLQLYLDGQPLPIRRPSRRELAWRWARRHTALVGSVAATTFAVVVATVVAFVLILGALGREKEANRQSQRAQRDRTLAQVEALLTAEPGSVAGILRDLEPYRADVGPRLRELAQKEDLPDKQRTRVRLALLPGDPSLVAPLRDALLNATPQELLLVRDALLPNKDDLTADLWQVAADPAAPAERRFRAACALAAYDPDSDRWAKIAPDVVAVLVGQDALVLGAWVEALRPARAALLDSLTRLYRAKDRPDEAVIAATVLGEYLADQPAQLADLLMDADARQYAALLPRLRGQEAALAPLRRELDRTLEPDWKDAPPNPTWTEPDPALVAKIKAAAGLVAERFALCQTMPFDDFLAAAEGLRPSGYRPTRFRPYAMGNGVAVAAVWRRDGRAWQMAHGLSAAYLRAQDRDQRGKGFFPIDVAGYVVPDGKGGGADRYAALWVESAARDADVTLFVGLTIAERDHATAPFRPVNWNYFSPRAYQELLASDGSFHHSSVWWRSTTPTTWRSYTEVGELSYEVRLTPSHLLIDVSLSPIPHPPTSVSPYASFLADISSAPSKAPLVFGSYVQHMTDGLNALAQGKDKDAVSQFTAAISALQLFPYAYSFRALTQARLGKWDEAREDLASGWKRLEELHRLSQGSRSGGDPGFRAWQAYADLVASAYLGEDGAAAERAEAVRAKYGANGAVLFILGRAYAAASGVVTRVGGPPGPGKPGGPGPTSDDDPQARARRYAGRAVALLREAAVHAFPGNQWEWETSPDLDPVRDNLTFLALLGRLHRRADYTATWFTLGDSAAFEGQESHGLPPETHLKRCRELAAQGYRPVGITAALIEGDAPVTASVWQRPVVAEEVRDALARRQANALLALLQLGQPELTWPRLRDSADNRLRSYLIERLGTPPADPQVILGRLRDEPDAGIRRALLLGLGAVPDTSLPPAAREPAIADLLARYRDDPDPGTHSAIDWLLRRWGQAAALAAADQQAAGDGPRGSRRWYVNGHGDSLAVVPGPVRFWMGSPSREADRRADEVSHPVQISRTFAIATKAVTVDQFLRFRPDHSYGRELTADGDGPIIQVSWYDAAAYCRWLSEQENIPEDQMCFPPLSQIGPDMVLPADYLSRTGYRLPTEAEWEYACRAGAVTSRPYGEDQRLLPSYAWIGDAAGNRAHPVGRLKPNDLGLFDVLGNVQQWCLDTYWREYATAPAGVILADAPPTQPDVNRVARGCRFGNTTMYWFRCAKRDSLAAAFRFSQVGFRVARTLPPPKEPGPAGELPPAGDLAGYVETLQLTPDAETFRARGDVYLDRGELDKAIADYDESLRRDPKAARPYARRGEAYLRKGLPDKAVADCTEAVRLDPKAAFAYAIRAAAYRALGKADLAAVDFAEAKKQLLSAAADPVARSIDLFDRLGDVHLALGEKAEAVAAWKKGIALAGPATRDQRVKAEVEKKVKQNP